MVAIAALTLAGVTAAIVAAVALLGGDDPTDHEPAGGSPSSTTQPSPEGSRPPVTTSEPLPATTLPDNRPLYDADELRVTDVRTGRYNDADRFVIEFNQDLDVEEVIEADEMVWSESVSFVLGDSPYLAECVAPPFSEELSTFVNVQVPSTYPQAPDRSLDRIYGSDDTVKLLEVAPTCVHGGRMYFAAALSEPGDVDAFILDNPGRLVIDIR